MDRELCEALISAWDELSWKVPKQLSDSVVQLLGGEDNLKSAMILGQKELGAIIESDELYIGVVYLKPGTNYPTHAHDATELYHTICGNAFWGPSMKHLKIVEPNKFVLHPSAMPHAFKVPKYLKGKVGNS